MTLRVKLEIVPHGDESLTREIGRLDINNIEEPFEGVDLYRVVEQTPDREEAHPDYVAHRRSDGAWALVRRVLKELKIKGP